MKKLILGIIAITICSNLFAQKNGRYKSTYHNGQIADIGEYKNDKKTGLWKYYYKNGQLQKIGEYKEDKNYEIKIGLWKEYYENGQLEKEMKYKNNSPIGIWRFYFEDGALRSKNNFNTNRDKYYYESGELNLIVDRNYNINNDFLGLLKQFHKNGKVKLECKIVNDYMIKRNYFDNGQLKSIKYIREKPLSDVQKKIIKNRPSAKDEFGKVYLPYRNLKIGVWKEYDRDGNLISEKDFGPLKGK